MSSQSKEKAHESLFENSKTLSKTRNDQTMLRRSRPLLQGFWSKLLGDAPNAKPTNPTPEHVEAVSLKPKSKERGATPPAADPLASLDDIGLAKSLFSPEIIKDLMQDIGKDPELLNLMRNPKVANAMMAVYQDPSKKNIVMNDPDVQKTIFKMQNLIRSRIPKG